MLLAKLGFGTTVNMDFWRHTFPNWFVFLLMIIPVAMSVGRRLSDMGRKSQEKHEAEIERYETLKRRREERERERQEVRRLYKLGWRTADIAKELQISTDRVRLDVRSEDSLEISLRGAIATLRELQNIASQAKSRQHKHGDPIARGDLELLLSMLADAQQRIDAEMDSTIAKANESPPFNNQHTMILIEKANSLPQTIIDLTLAAENNGAKSAKLLYELVVAEMDAAVARFYVTLNTAFVTKEAQAQEWMARYMPELGDLMS